MGARISSPKRDGTQHPTAPSAPPPPYNKAQRLEPKLEAHIPKERLHPEIRASDIPALEWKNSQCREWLVEVLVEKCGRDRAAAEIASEEVWRNGGFGRVLYGFSCEAWKTRLGSYDGQSIHVLLLTYRKEAIPDGIRVKLDAAERC